MGTGSVAQAQVSPGAGWPPGFSVTTLVDGLDTPTDMAFLPSGEILVAEKGWGSNVDGISRIRLVRGGSLQATPVLTLSTNVYLDSGLLALTLDPHFARNRHFYVWYAIGQNARGWDGTSYNRISRFTFDPATGTASPGSELVILDRIPWAEWHNGGGLHFGPDGYLYIALGDIGEPDRVQDLSTWNGKLLRIRPTDAGYEIPPDNPFRETPGALPEIYALGLRSPYRLAAHPDDGTLYLADVGAQTWEEVNRVQAGANYGWPVREGPCPQGQRQPCESAPTQYTDPILYYAHPPVLGGALTALAFSTGEVYPPEYRGKLFLADFNLQSLQMATLTEDGFALEAFADGAGALTDMEFATGGLYLLNIYRGTIQLLYHSTAANRPPTASLEIAPTLGPPPLVVTFSAAGTHDADDSALWYHWTPEPGGQTWVTTSPVFTHTYTADGSYLATLQVFDARGGASEPVTAQVNVYSGAIPSIHLENLTAPQRQTFQGGDRLRFLAVREGGTSGLDPERPYTWRIDLHHNQHTHPAITGYVGEEGIWTLSRENHGGDWNLWYRFYLTMRTDNGQEIELSREIYPDLSRIRVESQPGEAIFSVNGRQEPAAYIFKAIAGVEQQLEAPPTLLYKDGIGQFAYWTMFATGWPAAASPTETILPTRTLTILPPAGEVVYTAHYTYTRPAYRAFLPRIDQGEGP
ncbi:PQQ-dependent sugar dehydrogenase [Litorilinea aerophila]|nr:PQQ-dependent sugar dehydrogenase [Litorilinea aerophila]